MKTKMQVLAEVFDVEFNEEFILKWNKTAYRCRITETGGLFWLYNDVWHIASGDMYKAILFDNIEIFRLYCPTKREMYYILSFDCPIKCRSHTWDSTKMELWLYRHGLVCKTAEEADELATKLANYAKKIRS